MAKKKLNLKSESSRKNETQKANVALRFPGRGFPAGATCAGVMRGLVEKGAFGAYHGAEDEPGSGYEIVGFSGTSADALLAAVCWAHRLKGLAATGIADEDQREAAERKRNEDLIKVAERQWLYYAFPNNFAWMPVWNAKVAHTLTGIDATLRENPIFGRAFDHFRSGS